MTSRDVPHHPSSPEEAAEEARRARGLAAVAAARIENGWSRFFASAIAAVITAAVLDAQVAVYWLAGLTCFIAGDMWVHRQLQARIARGDGAPRSIAGLIGWTAAQSLYGNALGAMIWFAPVGPGPAMAVVFLCGSLANAAGTLRHAPALAAAAVTPTALYLLALPVAEFLANGMRDSYDLAPMIGAIVLLIWGAKLWNSLLASDQALANAEVAAMRERQAAALAAAARTDTIRRVLEELRTPLAAVRGASERLRRSASTPAAQDYVGILVQANEVLARVAEDLADIERYETGRLSLLSQNVDPREIARSAIAVFRADAVDRGIELFLDVAPDTPAVVAIDATRARQVLFSLVANAVSNTSYGGVRLRLSASPSAKDGCARLTFSVADTGLGLSRLELAQALARRSERHGAAGEAVSVLAIAANLARLMGGELMAKSEIGQGSLFSFVLDVPVVAEAGREAA